LLQPYVEVEGEKDELRQQVVGGLFLCQKSMDLILLRTLMSRVVLPTNHVGKPDSFFFSLVPPPECFGWEQSLSQNWNFSSCSSSSFL
jgi:hypothetical protein